MVLSFGLGLLLASQAVPATHCQNEEPLGVIRISDTDREIILKRDLQEVERLRRLRRPTRFDRN
jgi:hypothetical protein